MRTRILKPQQSTLIKALADSQSARQEEKKLIIKRGNRSKTARKKKQLVAAKLSRVGRENGSRMRTRASSACRGG